MTHAVGPTGTERLLDAMPRGTGAAHFELRGGCVAYQVHGHGIGRCCLGNPYFPMGRLLGDSLVSSTGRQGE